MIASVVRARKTLGKSRAIESATKEENAQKYSRTDPTGMKEF